MKVGFALSPGGLMLPYHLGALAGLEYHGQFVDPVNHVVAGSSSGSIATVGHGAFLPQELILEATIAVSDKCRELGGARGRLWPLIEEQMERLVGPDEFEHLQQDRRQVGVAYAQLFPQRKNYLQTSFHDRDDLFRAVKFSCMFPFFATNWPFILDYSHHQQTAASNKEEDEEGCRRFCLPRVMVDGVFTVPRDRYGCPEISGVDRTVAISAFPKDRIGLDAFDAENCISPLDETEIGGKPLAEYQRIALHGTSREEMVEMYEMGFQNAEEWSYRESERVEEQAASAATTTGTTSKAELEYIL